jgi:uncharacterized protein (TIGR00369 family)
MAQLPELDPAALGAFLRETAFHVERASGEEVVGHVDATREHHTPWGRVHGGLLTTIVESACSIGASVAVAGEGRFAVGLTNTTDFVRAHVEGRLDVRAWPVHQGRTGQLWQCDLTREDGKLVAQGRVRLQNVEPG